MLRSSRSKSKREVFSDARRWRGPERLEARQMLAGDVVISEFMASNDTGIRDEDFDRSDWIELYNNSDEPADLTDWFLTDDADNLDRWQFPATPLLPRERLVVFASGKNRAAPDQELHTNFRLGTAGEFLALVQPDGLTLAFSYDTTSVPMRRDVAFGLPQNIATDVPIIGTQPGKLLVPTAANGGADLGLQWTLAEFDDGDWSTDVAAIGYEQGSGYEDLIQTDVGEQMFGVTRSAYLRFPFDVQQPSAVAEFHITMQYDDGYVIYINGQEVARRNAPSDLDWQSGATAAHADRFAKKPETETIATSQFSNLLHAGENVVAIHALNDVIDSSDFLLIPQMTATVTSDVRLDERIWIPGGTPGAPNGDVSSALISDLSHTPIAPTVDEPLTITATTTTTSQPVAAMTLFYRVMYGDEQSVPMLDDGLAGDLLAGDGIFVATLPAGLAEPGQMIRYRATIDDTTQNSARFPLYLDPLNSELYRGIVVTDPTLESALPIVHLFIEDIDAANTPTGTRGSVYHDGQFYDNVEIDTTGRSIGLTGPKKSHDVQFTSDHWFTLNSAEFGEFVMNDFDIINDFWNREKFRVSLGYQTMSAIGTPSHLSMPVRIQNNGEFYSTHFFVDGGNEKFLERAGLNPNGALYKMNLGFAPSRSAGKKVTRTHEDYSDLTELFNGLGLTGDEKVAFIYDNIDVPAMVNYLAGLVVAAHGDCCGKNLYLYRDTTGSGDWQALPYDEDSAFGRGGVQLPEPYFVDRPGVFPGRDNSLIEALYDDVPGFTEMYLRRLRSVMDQFVQVPGTPTDQLYFENRVREIVEQMTPEGTMDNEKWGSWVAVPETNELVYASEGIPLWQDHVQLMLNEYFPARREFLYQKLTESNGGQVLPAQSAAPPINFAAVEPSPTSGNEDEEFIALTNPNDFAVDISGWQVTGLVQHTFRPGTVLGAGNTIYITPNIRAFRARDNGPSGGQRLLVQGDYEGRLANTGGRLELVTTAGVLVEQTDVTGTLAPTQQYLRVSELMYNPRDLASDGRFDAIDFEFIEFVNTSPTETLDLQHVRIADAVAFQFPATELGPGERIVVARQEAALRQRYGDNFRIAGEYGTTRDQYALSNGGELITIDLGVGEPIQSFTYDDTWHDATDGDGASLVAENLLAPVSMWDRAAGWTASVQLDGTPGSDTHAPNGDFDNNGIVDAHDIDLLCAALGREDLQYDLNLDNRVNDADVRFLVQNQLRTSFGDANLDGTFDSKDWVLVFQAGHYEDAVDSNSGWAHGDWNCDGEFTSADLVLAFQEGGYVGA